MDLVRKTAGRAALNWRASSLSARTWTCRTRYTQFQALARSQLKPQFVRFESTRRWSDRAVAQEKPFYVTTPIFYVNASPHIGHMYSMLVADVLKRYKKFKGKEAIMLTGTDEHGMKVQKAADQNEMHPKLFCDQNSAKFVELAQTARIEYDRFIRTTDEDHIEAVKHFWFLLNKHGHIYEAKHEGWYSVSDECFYPESDIVKTQDPFTGEVFMASVETGTKVEWVEEKNYHFRLTDFRDQLLAFYEQNPDFVRPRSRMNQVVDWVKNNLEDLSISRPSDRQLWGIPVPDDESQTIYVWVDALINYLTHAGFPGWTPGRQHLGGWPADVQVVGKDILRFHAVYWPALLMALGMPTPKHLLCHAHWTLDGKKMSKSIGNVVNPIFAIDRWGVDTIRFYMLYQGGIEDDADYSNTVIDERYRKFLMGGFGNLTSRLTRSPNWNLRSIVKQYHGDGLPNELRGNPIGNRADAFEKAIKNLKSTVEKEMYLLRPHIALQAITEMLQETNRYLTEQEPWALIKSEKSHLIRAGFRSLFQAAESLRVMALLLQPFMPDKASQILDALGVEDHHRTHFACAYGSDITYGNPLRDSANESFIIFPPPMIDEAVEEQKKWNKQKRIEELEQRKAQKEAKAKAKEEKREKRMLRKKQEEEEAAKAAAESQQGDATATTTTAEGQQ